jgi:hypothetical protein
MRENFYRFWLFLLLLAVLLVVFTNIARTADLPIALDVYPKFLTCIPSDRPTMRMRITMERHPDNRAYSLSWSGLNGHSGTSIVQMDGEDSERVVTRFQEITCTSYTIEACVYRTNKKKFCDHKELEEGEHHDLLPTMLSLSEDLVFRQGLPGQRLLSNRVQQLLRR